EGRPRALVGEVAGAETQRDRLQSQGTEPATTLSPRSAEPADLEERNQRLQAQAESLAEEQARAEAEARERSEAEARQAEEAARLETEQQALEQQVESDDAAAGEAATQPRLPRLTQPDRKST